MNSNSDIFFYPLKVEMSTTNGGVIYSYEDILYITCDKPYLIVNCINGRKIHIEDTLKNIRGQLPPMFFQCNKSTIINFHHLTEYFKNPWVLKMSDGALIPLSYRRVTEFKRHKASQLQNV